MPLVTAATIATTALLTNIWGSYGKEFVKWIVDKVGEKIVETHWNTFNDKGNPLDNKFAVALEKTAKKLQQKAEYKNILDNDFAYFFKQPEVFSELMKLCFRAAKLDIEIINSHFDTNTLPNTFIYDFITELKNEISQDREFDKIFADNEIYISILGIKEEVKKITQSSTITATEIRKIRKLLNEQSRGEVNFEQLIQKYNEITLQRLSVVNFLGLEMSADFKKGRERKKLRDIYVKTLFRIEIKSGGLVAEETLPFNEIFNYQHITHRHNIILGNPGSGKSLLSKFIICSILEQTIDDFDTPELYQKTPFRIELREYLAFKKKLDKGIFEYVLNNLKEDTQLDNLTPNTLKKWLLLKDSLFLFDGLDEIFDVSDKIKVKNDIEAFCFLYPNIQAIVTSRFTGYNDAALSESFTHIEIQDLTRPQIEEYVRKSYKNSIQSEVCEEEIQTFLDESTKIPIELLSNPLLLSLIVIVYQNTGELLKSRLEIYESCTKTLVDKWDKTKNLKIEMPSEKILPKKVTIFSELAYWQYELLSNGKEAEITHNSAKSKIQSVILEKLKLTEDWNEAENWAKALLDYAEKRSIYFDNNFTHKTFLEYYAAHWIYTNYEVKHKKAERNAILAKYVTNSFWSVVLELLICQIDAN